jgi:hypothetical protein
MIAALAIALLAGTSDPLPFAPPIDQPLRYRQTEHRLGGDGHDLSFTLVEEVDYARDGVGYVMTVRALSAEANAPAPAKAVFEAAMRPFVGVPVRLRLSAKGDPGDLIDADAVWAGVIAAIRASADALPADEPADHRALIERTARGLAALSPAARETMMKAPALVLLGLAVPDLGVGDSAPLSEPVETPAGPALPSTGTIRRDPDADGARHYVRELATSADAARALAAVLRARSAAADPATRIRLERHASAIEQLRIHEAGSITLSASSGLLLASVRHTTSADPAAPGGERPVAEQELLLLP